MSREKLGSRLGFILLSAGCAIGIGNVWKFPYVVGANGGGVFVLIYVLFLLIFGVPIMSMEFAMGRAAKCSPVKVYDVLAKPKSLWKIHGYVSMLGNYLLMMFYTTVSGWMLYYIYASISGKYQNLGATEISTFFSNLLAEPWTMTICTFLIIISGFLVISLGLAAGVERSTKIMMLLMLFLLLALAGHSLTLPEAKAGIHFYLYPDFAQVNAIGWGKVILAAMNQAFFTLSVGIGSMLIFASYIGKERTLLGEAVNVAVLDTLVALCSGLIIFPACSTYNLPVDSGPSLLFVTLPLIFNNLPGGRFWGSLFFVFMLFAAFSTVLAVFENIVACCMDLFKWSRKKAAYLNIFVVFILSMPCIWGFNILSGWQPFGYFADVLSLEDFLVSNLILPLGSLTILIFCMFKFGWGFENFKREVNCGKGLEVKYWMKGYLSYFLPIVLLIIFIIGLV